MSTPSLPLLTAANWYLWEQQALNSMTIFGHAGHSIQTNTPFILNEPCKPLRMFYLEEGCWTQIPKLSLFNSPPVLGTMPLTDHFITKPRKTTTHPSYNTKNIVNPCGPSYLPTSMPMLIISSSCIWTIPKQPWTLTPTNFGLFYVSRSHNMVPSMCQK